MKIESIQSSQCEITLQEPSIHQQSASSLRSPLTAFASQLYKYQLIPFVIASFNCQLKKTKITWEESLNEKLATVGWFVSGVLFSLS